MPGWSGILSFLLLAFTAMVVVAGEPEPQPEQDNTQETVWIDVRSWLENEMDGIEGDPHIPHSEIVAGVAEQFPDKSTPIRLYCSVGGRAGKALDELTAAGYTNIENAGGIDRVRQLRFSAETEEKAAEPPIDETQPLPAQ